MAEQSPEPQVPTPPPRRKPKFAKTRSELEMEILMKCAEDPRQFVRYMFGAKPTAQQDQILAAMRFPGAHVTVRSGHGIGKSSVMAWLILWFVLFNKDCKVPCTAPSGHQLKDVLWSEVANWHQKMP